MLERAYEVQNKGSSSVAMPALRLEWRRGNIHDLYFPSLIKILQLLCFIQSHQKSKYSILVIFTQK